MTKITLKNVVLPSLFKFMVSQISMHIGIFFFKGATLKKYSFGRYLKNRLEKYKTIFKLLFENIEEASMAEIMKKYN